MRSLYPGGRIVTNAAPALMGADLRARLLRAQPRDVIHLDEGIYQFDNTPIRMLPMVEVVCDNGTAHWLLPHDSNQEFACSVELSDGNRFENISFECAVTTKAASMLIGWTGTNNGDCKAKFVNCGLHGREYVFYSGGALGNCAVLDHCDVTGNGHLLCNQNSGGTTNLLDVIDSTITNDPESMPLYPDGSRPHRGDFLCQAVWQMGGRTRLIRCMVEMRGDPLHPNGFLRGAYLFDPPAEGGRLIELLYTNIKMVPNGCTNVFDIDDWIAPGVREKPGSIVARGSYGSGTDGELLWANQHTVTGYEVPGKA